MINSYRRLAKILRVKAEDLFQLDEHLRPYAIREEAIENVMKINDDRMKFFLKRLDLDLTSSAEQISSRIEYLLSKAEQTLFRYFQRPDFAKPATLKSFITSAENLVGGRSGYFLKKDIARKMILQTPPPTLLKLCGYSSAQELLEREDIYEIYALLRVVEDRDWMNTEFISNYSHITPLDFESREIEIIVLQTKWREFFKNFVEKKYHNLSHLKELGVIFILPINPEGSGFWLRIFSLLLHYIFEIKFYSSLFKYYTKFEDFNHKFQSALRGDIVEIDFLEKLKALGKPSLLIIQRYLAKENKDDPRLTFPHINPEGFHWEKAETILARLSKEIPGLDLDLFEGLDFVGDYFRSEREGEILVSFDLLDNIMSLVKEKEMVKYLYHHQEALWNKLFKEYLGEEKVQKLMLENFEKGYIIIE